MHTCMHAYIHACIHTSGPARRRDSCAEAFQPQAPLHTYTHAYIKIHACIHQVWPEGETVVLKHFNLKRPCIHIHMHTYIHQVRPEGEMVVLTHFNLKRPCCPCFGADGELFIADYENSKYMHASHRNADRHTYTPKECYEANRELFMADYENSKHMHPSHTNVHREPGSKCIYAP